MDWTYLNDSYFKKEDVKISPFDRGFLFGDAVYEVIPVYDGRAFLFSEHITRLEQSLSITGISKPQVWNQIPEIINKLIKKNLKQNQTIYLQITRGVDVIRSHLANRDIKSTLFISSSELKVNPYRMKPNKPGLEVKTMEDPRWQRCDVKAVTLLSNIMALEEANSEEKDDVIFHRNGKVTEGASSNVFAVFDNSIVTPPISQKILSGVTRNYVIDILLGQDLSIFEKEISVRELYEADEVWLTSSTKEVQPVKKIDNKEVGFSKPEDSLWLSTLSYFSKIGLKS